MLDPHTKTKLIAKIQHSLFLKEETKSKLISILDQLTDTDLYGVQQILDEGEQKEREMLTRLIENDPEFPAKLKRFMQSQIKLAYKEQEGAERQDESAYQENLLGELNNLSQ